MLRLRNRNEVVLARAGKGRPAPRNDRQFSLAKHFQGQAPRNRFIVDV